MEVGDEGGMGELGRWWEGGWVERGEGEGEGEGRVGLGVVRSPVWRMECQNISGLTIGALESVFSPNLPIALSCTYLILLLISIGWSIFSKIRRKSSCLHLLSHLSLIPLLTLSITLSTQSNLL